MKDEVRAFVIAQLQEMNYDTEGIDDDTTLGPAGVDLESLALADLSVRVEDRFGCTPWSTGEAGAPILEESLGVFECENYAVYDGGDHHILVGQVVKASFDCGLDPLLYFRGSYHRLHFD